MAESLRDLVVSLTMDSTKFDQNVRVVNQLIKQTRSEMAAAAEGVSEYESGLGSAGTRVEKLSEVYRNQLTIIENYTKKVAALQKDLTNKTEARDKGKTDLANGKIDEEQYERLANAALMASERLAVANRQLSEAKRAANETFGKIGEAGSTNLWEKLEQGITHAQAAVSTFQAQIGQFKAEYNSTVAGLEKPMQTGLGITAKSEELTSELSALKQISAAYEQMISAKKTQLNMKGAEKDYLGYQKTAKELANLTTEYLNCQAAIKTSQMEFDRIAVGLTGTEASIKNGETALGMFANQLKLVDSEFKLAGAGIKDFEKTSDGLTAKVKMLESSIKSQGDVVSNWERQLGLAKTAYNQIMQLRDQEAATNGTNTAAYAQYSAELLTARDRITQFQTSLNNANAKLKEHKAELERTKDALEKIGNGIAAAADKMEGFGKKVSSIGQGMTSIGMTFNSYFGRYITSGIKESITAANEFEQSFADVRKVTNATDEELNQLSQDIQDMSIEIGSGTDEIAKIMMASSQLGVSTGYLSEFTRIAMDMGNTTTISAEEAANGMARLRNITGDSEEAYSNMGSAITYLGNNFATTQGEILNMALNLAGAGATAGLTTQSILGIATALTSVGIASQKGGTAFSKVIIRMHQAVVEGNDDLAEFAKLSGMTTDEFAAMWKASPEQALVAFINGIKDLDDAGISAITILNDMGFSEVRLRDTLLRSVNASELMADAVETANEAWEENTALQESASIVYGTTGKSMDKLKENAESLKRAIGEDLQDTFKWLIDKGNGVITFFKNMDSETRTLAVQIGGLAAYGATSLMFLGRFTSLVGGGIGSIAKMGKGIAGIYTGISKFSKEISYWGGGFNGFLAAVGSGNSMLKGFATAAYDAGGGVKGLWVALKGSPALYIALAAAVVVATKKIAEWAAHTKEAQKAVEGIKKVSEEWASTDATSIFDSAKGLDAFGLAAENFATSAKGLMTFDSILKDTLSDAKEFSSTDLEEPFTDIVNGSYKLTDNTYASWMHELDRVWSSSKRKSKEQREEMVNDWKSGTDTIQKGLQGIHDMGDTGFRNETLLGDIDGDMKRLDDIDAQVEKLLKKRRKGNLTDADKEELDALEKERHEITIKYHLEEDANESYEDVKTQLEAQLSRGVDKETAGTSALQALEKTRTNNLETLNAEYDDEYAKTLLIEDEAKRAAEQEALQKYYAEEKNRIEQEYLETLKEIKKLTGKDTPTEEPEPTSPDTYSKMFEPITNKIGAQMGIAGEDAGQLFADGFTGASEGYDAILKDLDTQYTNELDAINKKAELDPEFDKDGAIEKLNEAFSAEKQAAAQAYLDTITQLMQITGHGSLTGDTSGYETEIGQLKQLGDALTTLVNTGDVSALQNVESILGAMQEGRFADLLMLFRTLKSVSETGGVEMPEGTIFTPENVATIEQVMGLLSSDEFKTAMSGVSEDAQEVGEAISSMFGKDGLGQETFQITPTFAQEGLDSSWEEWNSKGHTIDATVNIEDEEPQFSNSNNTEFEFNAAKSALKNGARESWLARLMSAANSADSWFKFGFGRNLDELTNVDESGASAFQSAASYIANGLQRLKDGQLTENEAEELQNTIDIVKRILGDDKAWEEGKNGQSFGQGILDNLAKYGWEGLDASNIVDSLNTALSTALSSSEGKTITASPDMEFKPGPDSKLDTDGIDQLSANTEGGFVSMCAAMELTPDENSKVNWGAYGDVYTDTGEKVSVSGAVEFTATSVDFNAGSLNGAMPVGEYGAMPTMNVGVTVNPVVEKLNVSALTSTMPSDLPMTGKSINVGVNVSAVADSVNTDAVVSDVPDKIVSNKTVTVQVKASADSNGVDTSGISVGSVDTSGLDVSADVRAAGAKAVSAARSAFAASKFSAIGKQIASGVASGITSGQSGIVTAMKNAAAAAVAAAKAALDIHSPSRVMRDEVGAMMMRGVGVGITKETKEQKKVIANASKFLADTAHDSAIAARGGTDNRKTYNDSSSVNLTGNTFIVRSDNDIHQLSHEIAMMTKKQQRGKGVGFA